MDDRGDRHEGKQRDRTEETLQVKFATFLGAKGLSARHVFVIGMNDGEFPENPKALTDAEACQFIVALTRAKFSCSLISNKFYSKELHSLVDRPSMSFENDPEQHEANDCSKDKGGEVDSRIRKSRRSEDDARRDYGAMVW